MWRTGFSRSSLPRHLQLTLLAIVAVALALLVLAGMLSPVRGQIRDLGQADKPIETDAYIKRWCWEPQPYSDWCHLYVAQWGEPWVEWAMVPASDPCWSGDMKALPPGLVFLVATCSNEYGESITEHGDYPGDTP